MISVSAQAATKKAAPAPTPAQIQPAPKPPVVDTLVFTDTSPREVGVLTWRAGRFEFKGDADKAARMFFEKNLKGLIDSYLKEKGCPGN